MKILGLNGSPRKKKWNTVTLIENVLSGAESKGFETELVHLYDLKFSGCISCFKCKKIDRKKDGKCSIKDDLTSVLNKIREFDAIVIGTPVYYGSESAATRAMLERLFFPYNKYSKDRVSLFPKKIPTALIYTMNVNDEIFKLAGYEYHINNTKLSMERTFGSCELLLSKDTMQYKDYEKYEHEMFDKEAKVKRNREVFPEECEKAFELGCSLISGIR